MVIGTADSINKKRIRLTTERWFHISQNHPEVAGDAFTVLEVISNPGWILEGHKDELLAVKKINRNYFVTVYKEEKKDGFVLTAFVTKHKRWLFKRKVIWQKKT